MSIAITVKGNVGSEPELKFSKNNKAWATFNLAHTPRERKGEEWVDGETNWYRVIKFGASAEAITQTLKKGDEVIVIGSLKLNTYTDKNGIEKSQMEISASEIGVVPKVTKNKTQTNTGGSEPW